jgi:hypothetical protein
MRAHLLAEQTGLGSNAGAVLVGSGGDGLGEATRGPRASRSNGGVGGDGGVFSSGVGRAFAFGPGVGSAPLPFVDGKPKSARSGVAADPNFRGSMWRFVAGEALRASGGRDSPAPSPSDFDGAGLDGVRVDDVRCFVIKSYSEDDVHKSVKYGCWTSTAQGNARLDAAWRCEVPDGFGAHGDLVGGGGEVRRRVVESSSAETSVATSVVATEVVSAATAPALSRPGTPPGSSEGRVIDLTTPPRADRGDSRGTVEGPSSADSASGSPGDSSVVADANGAADANADSDSARPRILLFFSVNSSGHFCGVAEMVGPVDHELRADFWQRDKWPGCFEVRWHLVKDVPNSALRHIRLVQGDKKPVTNSRDAQEVEPSQGMLVLNVFREFRASTTLLDDFEFFGRREKVRASLRRMRDACGGGRFAGGRAPFRSTGSHVAPAAFEFHPGWMRALGFHPPPYPRWPPRAFVDAAVRENVVDPGRARVEPPEPDPSGNPGGGDGFPPPFARDANGDAADAKENAAGRRDDIPIDVDPPLTRIGEEKNAAGARGGGGGGIGARLPPFRFGVEGEAANA